MEITLDEELRINPVKVLLDTTDIKEVVRQALISFKKSVLKPTYRQKSFYSKAHVLSQDSIYVLKSYQTPVMAKVNGRYYKLWDDWSQTTSIHVNSFIDTYGGFHLSKAEWNSIPVNTPFMFSADGCTIIYPQVNSCEFDDDDLPFY